MTIVGAYLLVAGDAWQIWLAALCPVLLVAVLGYLFGADIYAWLRSLLIGSEEDE